MIDRLHEKIDKLREKRKSLEQTLQDVDEEIKGLYKQIGALHITEAGQKLGIKIWQGKEIISTEEMAKFTVGNSTEWINPPFRQGSIGLLEAVLEEGFSLFNNGWQVTFPLGMIVRAIQAMEESHGKEE